jgi:hypothetical protein
MTGERLIKKRMMCAGFLVAMGLGASFSGWAQNNAPPVRVIEILADHDSRYKMAGMKQPEIAAKAGEAMTLRITARKAQNHNRDGSVHGFTLLRAKDRKPVPGWDLLLRPGTQDFNVVAPGEPGEYLVICTVICSEEHEGMSMKLVVTP